ncbi:MAG: DUF4445 domain-containing protein [Holophagaceae bacterium]|nr:DUF4445 domain-containing protein [Holophagaceae bacterium]
MANLRVGTSKGQHWLTVDGAQSVREALAETEARVPTACGGVGTCGACVVRVVSGQTNPPTAAECRKLSGEELARGLRLACQLRVGGDAEIEVEQGEKASSWASIPLEELPPGPGLRSAAGAARYGVAVDLGTTRIRVSLWDLAQGRRIASRSGPNPQEVFGADVLNRVSTAVNYPHRRPELTDLARGAILQAIGDILAQELGDSGVPPAELGRIVVVGNTAMLALLTGAGLPALLDPTQWQRAIEVSPMDPSAWQAEWHLGRAEILLPAPLAGFVGSDLLAAVVGTGLLEGPPGSLLVDVGTNTELALWDGSVLHVSSVPGGPAFEGAGLRFGAPAGPGAIAHVLPCPEGEGFICETFGGLPARGFCGSGLVDAVALLLGAGLLKPSGRFSRPAGPGGHPLDPAIPQSALSAGDVDTFQRAKAAQASAMEELLELAGLGWRDLRRLCVCGAFGRSLHVGHAQAVGLLPQVEEQRIELHGHAALVGCEWALLATDANAVLAAVASRARLVNLSLIPDWEDRYMAHLRLGPIPLESCRRVSP